MESILANLIPTALAAQWPTQCLRTPWPTPWPTQCQRLPMLFESSAFLLTER